VRFLLFAITVIAITGSLLAQDIQVNRQNKTIAVTADESTTADAEIAVLAIGYHNYGLTQDAAFKENVRAAERVTNALLDAKVPKANIETEKLRLTRTEIDEKWTPDMKKERQFVAEQSWHVSVSASEAQAVVDLAVRAGANEVDDVEWNVADPLACKPKQAERHWPKPRLSLIKWQKGWGRSWGN